MEQIPLDQIPNQEFNVTLNDQDCTLHLYQSGRRMYLDLSADGETIRQGCICTCRAPILGTSTTFEGNLYFVDTLSTSDTQEPPQYSGLNDRWILIYLDADEFEEVLDTITEIAEDG